jgi:hypothetical protein
MAVIRIGSVQILVLLVLCAVTGEFNPFWSWSQLMHTALELERVGERK